MMLPEYITEFPDIPVKIETSLQDLLCEVTVSPKRLNVHPTTQITIQKSKPNAKKQPPKNEAPPDDQASTNSKMRKHPPKSNTHRDPSS